MLDPTFGIVTGGLGLLGSAIGLGRSSRTRNMDFTVDPNFRALDRYSELTNPDSPYNRRSFGLMRRLAEDAGPSSDSLMNLAAAQGIGGSSYLGLQQGRAYSDRARESALNSFENYMINNEANAARYLGMDYDNRRFARRMSWEANQGADDSFLSFADSLLKGGIGLLGYSYLKDTPVGE